MPELTGSARIHLVGAGGAGMSALAKLLAQMGHTVSGSDLKPGRHLDALGDLGVEVWTGSRPGRAGRWDLVVASSAVPDTDPELEAARRAGVEVWWRPRLLRELTRMMPAIGLAGTHGKTTCTALLVTALRGLGRDPSFVVGGEMTDLATNAHLGEPELFVLEADEAFGTFLELRLDALVVTNVEGDHLDHYRTLERLEEAFAEVAAGVEGPVLVGVDDGGGRRLARRSGASTFGTHPGARWRVDQVEPAAWSVSFRLRGPGLEVPVEVSRPGVHVARDAAGVLGLVAELGLDAEEAASALKDFRGVQRRFEVRGRVAGVTIVDDYAHHPTEVAASLGAVRREDWRTVWAVFQPHLYSRTARLHRQLGEALGVSDRVVVTDVYAAREQPIPGVTGELVARAVEAAGTPVDYVPHRGDVAGFLAERVAPGDLVLTLGAGDVTLVADELAKRLAAR